MIQFLFESLHASYIKYQKHKNRLKTPKGFSRIYIKIKELYRYKNFPNS